MSNEAPGFNDIEHIIFQLRVRKTVQADKQADGTRGADPRSCGTEYKNKDIAHELGISPGTVKIHLKHVFEKTGVVAATDWR